MSVASVGRRRWLVIVGFVLLTATLLAGVAWAMVERRATKQARAEVNHLSERLRDTEGELSQARTELSAEEAALARTLDSVDELQAEIRELEEMLAEAEPSEPIGAVGENWRIAADVCFDAILRADEHIEDAWNLAAAYAEGETDTSDFPPVGVIFPSNAERAGEEAQASYDRYDAAATDCDQLI